MCGLAIAFTIRRVIESPSIRSLEWTRRDDEVELRQQLGLLVEAAVVEDVDLDAGEDPERRQLVVERRPPPAAARAAARVTARWPPSAAASGRSAPSTRGRGRERSRPSRGSASRRRTSPSARGSRRAAPYAGPPHRPRPAAHRPVRAWPGSPGTRPASASMTTLDVASPTPLSSVRVPASARSSTSPGRERSDRGGRPPEGTDAVGRLLRALEQERDPLQRLDGFHAGQSSRGPCGHHEQGHGVGQQPPTLPGARVGPYPRDCARNPGESTASRDQAARQATRARGAEGSERADEHGQAERERVDRDRPGVHRVRPGAVVARSMSGIRRRRRCSGSASRGDHERRRPRPRRGLRRPPMRARTHDPGGDTSASPNEAIASPPIHGCPRAEGRQVAHVVVPGGSTRG